jgi:hypothetical protein
MLLPIIVCCGDPERMQTIKDVKRAHEAQLLSLPDIASVGIGRDENGNPAIIVHLARPNPATESKIPETIDGFPVIVNVSGPVKAQGVSKKPAM